MATVPINFYVTLQNANAKYNDLAAKHNDLATKFNTVLDRLEALTLLAAS